ncbi:MAG TPA: 2'-5' RNA ligase family protein [Dehalococcoidia bacterium]|nr:2'-5' RNA ligase family protein [Dehalococcoidia bacterium]
MQSIVTEVDDPFRGLLEDVWGELKAVFGLPAMVGATRPRFAYHCAGSYDAGPLRGELEQIARDTPAFTVTSAGLGVFRGARTVLAVTLHREGEVGALHRRIWHAAAPFARETRPAYAPATWAPHITIAAGDLGDVELDVMATLLERRGYRWAIPVTNLGILDAATDAGPAWRIHLGGVTSS